MESMRDIVGNCGGEDGLFFCPRRLTAKSSPADRQLTAADDGIAHVHGLQSM